MKKICLLFSILIATSSLTNAQKLFLRLYDDHNKKIAKGFLAINTDSTIIKLKKSDSIYSFPVHDVAYIKTKRTIAHSFAVGGLIGAPVGALIGIGSVAPYAIFPTGDPVSNTNYAPAVGAGLLAGAAAGAVIGGITQLFNKRQTFEINGSVTKWNEVRTKLE